MAQIQSLRAEKRARTRIQKKIGSHLLHETKKRRGEAITPRVQTLRTGVTVAGDGTTLVDIDTPVTPRVLQKIQALGGRIVVAVPDQRSIRAHLPIERLEQLAEMGDVRRIRPAGKFMTHKDDTSEGDVAHRADELRSFFGVDGIGIGIGVLSDGVDTLAARQATGDLPPTITVLPGQAGSGDEGTAMLEIVFDLAPGADLYFATAFNGQASFAANIIALRAAGADIIVDDVAYFAEAVHQDDNVAAAVDTVFDDGALYFSAAGNEGNLNDGTSGAWEGDFNFTGPTLNGDDAHDWDGLGTILNEITVDSPFAFALQWADPQDGSSNDYDLYLLSRNGMMIEAASTDVQDGDDDPIELISSSGFNDAGSHLVVARTSGNDRFLHLTALRGQLEFATNGQISGHSAARGAISVAAVRASTAQGPGGTFDGTESVETFSSDGPRRVFYAADGTDYLPAFPLFGGGQVRDKPDITAADCVATSTPGFSTFCGTSAAAPHAAAIAALLMQLGGPHISQSQVVQSLQQTALDIESLGADVNSGAGLIDAFAAANHIVELVPALSPIALAVLISAIALAGTRRS